MKKVYETPQVEVVNFSNEDVITTSTVNFDDIPDGD